MKDLYAAGAAPVRAEEGKPKSATRPSSRAYRVLLKPLVTEKASVLGAQNKYVFNVSATANKVEVAKAIHEVYGIKPLNVNMVKVLGKITRSGRYAGKRKDWKKAIVTLPQGKTIKVYEGV